MSNLINVNGVCVCVCVCVVQDRWVENIWTYEQRSELKYREKKKTFIYIFMLF